MASEMFARLLYLPIDTEPDWNAALAKAAELRFADFEDDSTFQWTALYEIVVNEVQLEQNAGRESDPDYHFRAVVRRALSEIRSAYNDQGMSSQLAEFQIPGWRLFFTGTYGEDDLELGTSIAGLEPLGVLDAAGFNPKHLMVEILSYSNRHGVDVSCHLAGKGDAAKAAIARDNWSEITGSAERNIPDEPPEDDTEAVSIFVENLTPGEYLDCDLVPVQQ